jgi:hypothetical protein
MSNKLLQLQNKWDKILAKDGFTDIEHRESGNLRTFHSTKFRCNYDPEYFKFKQEYYRLASHLIHDYKWTSERDKGVWIFHTEGLTYKEIGAKYKVSANSICKIVKKYRVEMEKFYGFKGENLQRIR